MEKTVQSSVTTPALINAPIDIAIKQYLMFKLVRPAIKLPVHTPVNGKGTATKQSLELYIFLNSMI